MRDLEPLLQSSLLIQTLGGDSTQHFMKRLAYLTADGIPPEWVFTDPRHRFVLEAQNRLSRVEGAIRQSVALIKQVEVEPPDHWLQAVMLTADAFVQQTLDHFTLVLYSTLDRSLLLATFVLSLGIHVRLATYKAVQKELRARDVLASQAFLDLYEAVGPLSDPRHFYAHRGEPRRVPLFSDVSRAKTIVSAWGAPPTGVVFSEAEGRAQLLATMDRDLTAVAAKAVTALDSLTKHYEAQRDKVGGIDTPTDEERTRALATMRYFQGGERPAFVDGGS